MKTQSKNQLKLVSLWLLSFSFLWQPARLLAQGSLTPPGAPAPMMKTLAQMEPRTAITNSGALTISTPGSVYYLTTNITVSSGDAITITANNVTLDLNGFTISSTAVPATTNSGILMSGGRTNIAIFNGHINSGVATNNAGVFSGSGFGYGIYYSSNIFNVRVKDVSVTGVLYNGIYINQNNSSVVAGCTVNVAGNEGILADSVTDSTAINCGYGGISAITMQNCYGASVGSGSGLASTTALNCYGISTGNGGYGIYSLVAQGCFGYALGNGGYGIYSATVENCYGISAGTSYAVFATTAQNTYGICNGSGNGITVFAVAIGCRGSSTTGTGLSAYIANSCYGTAPTGTPQNISFKYNMP